MLVVNGVLISSVGRVVVLLFDGASADHHRLISQIVLVWLFAVVVV